MEHRFGNALYRVAHPSTPFPSPTSFDRGIFTWKHVAVLLIGHMNPPVPLLNDTLKHRDALFLFNSLHTLPIILDFLSLNFQLSTRSLHRNYDAWFLQARNWFEFSFHRLCLHVHYCYGREPMFPKDGKVNKRELWSLFKDRFVCAFKPVFARCTDSCVPFMDLLSRECVSNGSPLSLLAPTFPVLWSLLFLSRLSCNNGRWFFTTIQSRAERFKSTKNGIELRFLLRLYFSRFADCETPNEPARDMKWEHHRDAVWFEFDEWCMMVINIQFMANWWECLFVGARLIQFCSFACSTRFLSRKFIARDATSRDDINSLASGFKANF